jgi:hypothetical protein
MIQSMEAVQGVGLQVHQVHLLGVVATTVAVVVVVVEAMVTETVKAAAGMQIRVRMGRTKQA